MPLKAPITVRHEPLGLSAGLGSTAPAETAQQHGDLEVNYVYSGGLDYFVGGRFVELGAGSLAAFWAAMPHKIVSLQPDTEFMFVRVPLATLLRWNLATPFTRRVLSGDVAVDVQSPAWDSELTRRWIADLGSEDPNWVRTAELEIEARLRRLAQKRQPKAQQRLSDHKARQQVEAITSYLAENYRDDISTSDIGTAVKLHPNYAMTLFRRECGMSIWQYLIRLRLSHAQLMLLSSEKTVLAIALESGFGSLARFYAAFTRECGISPGEFRKRAQ